MRWPDGIVRCPTCGDKNVEKYERPATRIAKKLRSITARPKGKQMPPVVLHLPQCRLSSAVLSNAGHHLPRYASAAHSLVPRYAIMLNAKKGISAKQLQRDLGIGGYKTAWYLNHRIREVMIDPDATETRRHGRIDETYMRQTAKDKKTIAQRRWKQRTCRRYTLTWRRSALIHMPKVIKENLKKAMQPI